MFTPDRMEQVHVVFSIRDLDMVAETILKDGSLQLVDSAEMEDWAESLDHGDHIYDIEPMNALLSRVDDLFRTMNLPKGGWTDKYEGTLEACQQRVSAIEREIKTAESEKDALESELGRLKDLRHRLLEMPNMRLSIENESAYTYLFVKAGRVDDDNMEILQRNLTPILHVLTSLGSFGGRTTVALVGLKRDQQKLENVLREAAFAPLDLDKDTGAVSPEMVDGLNNKMIDIQNQLNEKEKAFRETISRNESDLRSIRFRLKRDLLKHRMVKDFRKTDRTYLVSGWIPSDDKEGFISTMKRATRSRCIIESARAEDVQSVREGKVDVPVRMNNPPPFKPFEIITKAYGVPAYRTIDPTPVLGISFLLMFGMMFGDVGHGLVLALLGILFLLRSKAEFQKHVGLLLCYVGASSMIFGFLFGSLFGFEHLSWMKPLWLRPMESISTLFKVTIRFGMGMIFLSILINVINAVRLKKFWNVIFDHAGLLSALLYWCGIVLASRIVTESPGVKSKMVILAPGLIAIALILLFFREPIVHLAEGKKKLYPEGAFTGIVSGLIELMEIVLGFLANTVSFIRIAAFGLVHAGLAMAIFSLADSVNGVGSVLIIIFGNIFIIMLEGLIVSIQSVRLEFYEFFSRFFKEGPVGYKPLRSELINP